MIWLILGLVVLIGVHLVPSAPALRQALIQRLGFGIYRGLFALVAVTGLVLIVLGMKSTPYEQVWQPPYWGRSAVPLFMLPALILLVGAYLPGNVHRITPHPMLWGVILWAVGHLLATGDLAAVVLFSSLGLYSIFDIWSANRRGAAKATVQLTMDRDLIVIGIGVVLYVALVFLHPILFGMPAIPNL